MDDCPMPGMQGGLQRLLLIAEHTANKTGNAAELVQSIQTRHWGFCWMLWHAAVVPAPASGFTLADFMQLPVEQLRSVYAPVGMWRLRKRVHVSSLQQVRCRQSSNRAAW